MILIYEDTPNRSRRDFVNLGGQTAVVAEQVHLDTMRDHYSKQLEQTKKPLTDLGTKYRAALIELKEELQKNANLDGLLEAQKELRRFDKEKAPTVKFSKLELIARLQTIYETSYRQHYKKSGKEIAALRSTYRGNLTGLMRTYTKEGNTELALLVRKELELLEHTTIAPITLETELVLHFQFEKVPRDSKIFDSSKTGNHGRLMGDAKVSSTGGTRGNHVVLDGKGDFIEIPHHESLALTTAGTISIWIRPRRLDNTRGIVSKYTPKNSWTLRTWKDAGCRKISFGDFDHHNMSVEELKENRWTHLVVTFREGNVSIYFNGLLDSEGKRPAALVTNSNAVRIGSCYDGRYFTGTVDDVRIYRRALSGAEVTELFRMES